MSEADPPEQAAAQATTAADPVRSSKSAVARFIGTFVVLVIILLVGYRFAMNTPANIWYLFQVARHTAWALSVIGESGEVEPVRAHGPPKWRADLAKWEAERKGKEAPDGAISQGPLTAWESWQWKAWSKIRDGGTIAEDGPLVHFVLDAGLAEKQDEARSELQRLHAESRSSGMDYSAEIADLEKRADDLASELQKYPQGAERSRASRGAQFSFHLIPDCGAIPSMSIFLAAVLAFPSPWWKRIVGAVGGLSILYAVNISRLATLGYIGAIDTSPGRKWFTFAHEYVWQGVFIVFVVAVWMLWIEFLVRPRRT